MSAKMKENKKQGGTVKNARITENNKEIMGITYGFLILFLAVLGHLVYFAATNKEELLSNSYNGRQAILAEQNSRGKIYSREKEILAETVIGADGKQTRNYPYANLFSHAVGYCTKGRMGLEAQANYYLIHSDIPFADKVRYEAAEMKSPGNCAVTTLSVNLQQVIDREMGIYKGAVVVMKPDTGEILAMVSKPDYDPNEIAQIWEDVIEDEESTVLLNRAAQGLYPPGSTFKMITALEYMRENPDSYQDFHFDCNGSYTQNGNTIRCYHGTKHGSVDFTKAFAKSCNASFASIGMQLQKDQFADTLEELLFYGDLPVNMSYRKSSALMSEDISDGEMIQTVIGQGKTQMTPLHLCMITSAIANDGVLMKPYMIDRIENDNGAVIKQFQPETYGNIMNADEARRLNILMQEVVASGTATKLADASYKAAGKTGSAEYNGQADSHAWFTGFAPAEDPQIAVTIIIEGAGSGGDYAAPMARRIFDAYLSDVKAQP